jgi:hypothetical protein
VSRPATFVKSLFKRREIQISSHQPERGRVLLISYQALFIALDIPDGKSPREVNNDIDGVSDRGGEPDTAMAGRPDRVVADRKANKDI